MGWRSLADALLRGAAERLRDWADRTIAELDSARPVPSVEPPGPGAAPDAPYETRPRDAGSARRHAGWPPDVAVRIHPAPPVHWLDRVRRGGPAALRALRARHVAGMAARGAPAGLPETASPAEARRAPEPGGSARRREPVGEPVPFPDRGATTGAREPKEPRSLELAGTGRGPKARARGSGETGAASPKGAQPPRGTARARLKLRARPPGAVPGARAQGAGGMEAGLRSPRERGPEDAEIVGPVADDGEAWHRRQMGSSYDQEPAGGAAGARPAAGRAPREARREPGLPRTGSGRAPSTAPEGRPHAPLRGPHAAMGEEASPAAGRDRTSPRRPRATPAPELRSHRWLDAAAGHESLRTAARRRAADAAAYTRRSEPRFVTETRPPAPLRPAFSATPETHPWPELPQEAGLLAVPEWWAAAAESERLGRLRLEQRGEPWNV